MSRGRPIVRRDTGDKTASLQRSRLKSITGRSCFRSTIRKVNNSFLPPFSSIFLIRDREIKLNVKSLPILLSRSDRWNRRITKIIGEEQSVNFRFATIARKGSDSNWSPRSVVNSLVRLVWHSAKGERSKKERRNEVEADRVEAQCFCYICQLIGRSSWERLCGEQTWPTMRELKEKPEASGCFSCGTALRAERGLYFCFRNDSRSVTSCPIRFEITSIHRSNGRIVRRRLLSDISFPIVRPVL